MPNDIHFVDHRITTDDTGRESHEWNVCDKNLGPQFVIVTTYTKSLSEKICDLMNKGII